MKNANYDAVIIGAGASGAALAFTLRRYTNNIGTILIIEKEKGPGLINSHHTNNSQTLHVGDIETNYSREKATEIKAATDPLVMYLQRCAPEVYSLGLKMVLAVGIQETVALGKRFTEFKSLYPNLRKIDAKEIGELEPKIMQGRDPQEFVLALVTEGYTVDFGKLSESFIRIAKESEQSIEIMYDTKVTDIIHDKENARYFIHTDHGMYTTKTVACTAGAHSLLFAKKLGYKKHWGVLPVAGSFYFSKIDNLLQRKVYTMQKPKLPFAAIHADPEFAHPEKVRFGPTAKVLPVLERHRLSTISDFLQTSVWSFSGIRSLFKILLDPTIFSFVGTNLLFDIPLIGKYFFLRHARKIIPTLRYKDLEYCKGAGGIRPQVVNTDTGELVLGDARIVGDNIIFNITPSPGASVCLHNALIDTKQIVSFLGEGCSFNEEKWNEDFMMPVPKEVVV